MSADEGPVPLSDALSALLRAGLLPTDGGTGAEGARGRGCTGVNAETGGSDGAGVVDDEWGVPDTWTDSPCRVLDRTDELQLSDVAWDVGAIREAVYRIAEITGLPCESVVVHRSPADFPDPGGGSVDRISWGRHVGALADVALEERLSAELDRHGAPQQDVPARRGRTLWALGHAESDAAFTLESEQILRYSVRALVARYAGLMLAHRGRIADTYWQPTSAIAERFHLELQVGALLLDAFCAGLGYLAPAGRGFAVARRPAVRVLDSTMAALDIPRFHHDAGPAVEFADGTGSHFLEGVPVTPWLRQGIVDGAITMRYVRQFARPEMRMAAYGSMPPSAFLDGLESALVDVGSKGTYLYRVDDLPDLPGEVWYMVMQDPSTGREYGEFVPPEVGRTGSADAAQAAAWGISVSDYLRMTLEG